LGLVQAVANVSPLDGPAGALRARVGLATGLVVVGDVTGSVSSPEVSVIGDTPNLAARLQAIAHPGAVVIDATTRRLTGELFELRDLGSIAIKGLREPIHAWAALAENLLAKRIDAL